MKIGETGISVDSASSGVIACGNTVTSQPDLIAYRDRMAGAIDTLDMYSQQLHNLADRLYGPKPDDDSAEPPKRVPNGICDELHYQMDTLAEKFETVAAAISRLDRIA